ncbi:MAG TPA: hypothetical protein ENI99_13475 [Sedimenticola sp.]|nr:hypothetical protein [Sedimenticola sp.]
MSDLSPSNAALPHASCIVALLIGMLLANQAWPQDDLSHLPDPTRPDLGLNDMNAETKGGPFSDLLGAPVDEPPPPPQLSLQYTLISDKRRLAVINGSIIAEGEFIADAQIIEVRPEQVIARRGEKEIILSLARYQAKNEEPGPDTDPEAGEDNDVSK